MSFSHAVGSARRSLAGVLPIRGRPRAAFGARLWVSIVALSAIVGLSPAASAPRAAPGRHACCHVAAGTVVEVELVDEVSSAHDKRGDTFALRLAQPLIVGGMVVLRRGAPGVGEVIESTRPGIGGKPAKMVLAARFLRSRRGPVQLNALQLARPGHDNSTTSQILGLGGIAFTPLGFAGIALPGGKVVFQPGTVATAKIASDITLPPLARASRHAMAAAAASAAAYAAQDADGPIAIPPPPPGQGQVVFFRPKSLMGTGQWFNVRESGKALGKLSNGAYFVQVTDPGVHTYTATLEPELKDRLNLDIDAGETYFVEGTLTGGLVISAANLSPSSRATFNRAAGRLQPAVTPTDDRLAGQPAAAPTDPSPPSSSDGAPQPPQSADGTAAPSDASPPPR